jgi:hypothetical protein
VAHDEIWFVSERAGRCHASRGERRGCMRSGARTGSSSARIGANRIGDEGGNLKIGNSGLFDMTIFLSLLLN